MEKTKNSYKKSGVNIALANTFVKHIAKISKKMTKKRGDLQTMTILVLLALLLTLARAKLKIL